MSARERRRKENSAQSYDRPHSARVKLVDSSKSTVITNSERRRYEDQKAPVRHRQPSIADDSSSSDEGTLKESEVQRHNKEKNRENKEMNNFISLLDNTLQLNKDDDKSDEEAQEIPEVKVVTEETPRIPKSSSMPSVDTLCNHDRLMARIKLLHADCIKGVGWNVLKQAYEILGRIEEDEVEPKLVTLMGKENFDLYAGKIWQLKFCEDMARIGLPS